MTAQWIWILCLNCLVKPIKASILIQANGEKKPYPITHCPVSFIAIQEKGISLDNGWKGYQSREKRGFLTETGLKEDYATCMWNNKPLSKDNNCRAPPQANEPRFARSVSSIPQNVQEPWMGLKAVISSSLGWLTAAACGAEPGKPGEWCTCWGRCGTGCHHGSVLSLQTQGYSLHIPDTLLHARQNLTLLCTPLLHHLQPERLLSDLNDLWLCLLAEFWTEQ